MNWFTAAMQFLANVTGIAAKRQELNNSREMQQRAQAGDEVKASEATTTNVAGRKLDELRKDASE